MTSRDRVACGELLASHDRTACGDVTAWGNPLPARSSCGAMACGDPMTRGDRLACSDAIACDDVRVCGDRLTCPNATTCGESAPSCDAKACGGAMACGLRRCHGLWRSPEHRRVRVGLRREALLWARNSRTAMAMDTGGVMVLNLYYTGSVPSLHIVLRVYW